MRFGENFLQGADPKNRMDVLKIKDGEVETPTYINFGLEIRDKLREQVKAEGWPSLPEAENIQSAEDIFEIAKNEVDKTWKSSVQGLVQNKANDWLKELNTEDQEMTTVKEILSNPEELAQNLSLNQLGSLEILRGENPEAWRSLNIAAAEKQMASIAILEHWLRDGSNEKGLEAITAKIGLNKEELKLFVDLAGVLGKYVDQAFIKQMELADLPGGSDKTKLGNRQGAELIYDLYKESGNSEITIKTYKEMFPFEWKKIQERLADLAQRTKTETAENILPADYMNFGNYLEQMSAVYGSDEVKLKKLSKQWEGLSQTAASLKETDCPIMLIPQGAASVTGEAGKVDIEMRLGLKTAETRRQEKEFEIFRNIAQELVDENQSSLEERSEIPQITFNYQPWAFGPNLNSVTVGESEKSQILVHANADKEIVKQKELPTLERIFSEENVNLDDYLRAVVNENTLHEIGHNVLESEDEKVHSKIGGRFEAGILEELKAETMGPKILLEAQKRGTLPDRINLKDQLLAKLGTTLNYLKKSNKVGGDGEEYFICGSTIMERLLTKKLITKVSGHYELGNTEACFEEMSSIGEEVLNFYTEENSKPGDVKNYINKLRAKAKSPLIQEFIADLKNRRSI